MATIVFACGAEHGDLADWTEIIGAVTADTTYRHVGAYAIKAASTLDNSVQAKYDFASGASHLVASFYLYFAALPAASCLLASSRSASDNNAQFGFDAASGKFVAWGQGNWAGRTQSGVTVATGTWYRIDLHHDRTTNPDVLHWRIDGAAQTDVSGTNAGGASVSDSLVLGHRNADELGYTAWNGWYDDAAVSVTAGDYPLRYTYVGGSPEGVVLTFAQAVVIA